MKQPSREKDLANACSLRLCSLLCSVILLFFLLFHHHIIGIITITIMCSLIMSKSLLPFSEAKSCADIECTFCPCGATRMRFAGGKLCGGYAGVEPTRRWPTGLNTLV